MDSLITLIAIFVIVFIFMSLASWLLPFILPILIVIWILSLIFGRRHVHVHTFHNTQDEDSYYQEQPKSAPKNGAIDVEYTERDDDGDNQ